MHDPIRFDDSQKRDEPATSADGDDQAAIQIDDESGHEDWPDDWVPATE